MPSGVYKRIKKVNLSEKTKEKIRIYRTGKKHSEQTISRMSTIALQIGTGKSNKGKRNHLGIKHSDETKEKIRDSVIEYLSTHMGKFRDTDIEIIIEKMLIKSNISFIKQYKVKNVALVDFFLPKVNTIIECDGDFWHSKDEIKKKDKIKNKKLRELGYKIIRIKGSVIKKLNIKQFLKLLK